MINKFLCLFAILTCCSGLSAQEKPNHEWNLGVGVGPTFSNMSIVPTNPVSSLGTKGLTQFHGGISVRYNSENHLGLIGEINFSQQGWKSEFPDSQTNNYSHTGKLNYLEIPLLTHIYFGSKKTRFFFNLGPQIGYLLSQSHTRNNELNEWLLQYDDGKIAIDKDPGKTLANGAESYRMSADKKLDYGITLGGGMELRTKTGNFALEGRYYMGFGDIYNNRKRDVYSRSANRVMYVRLTYFMEVFKK